MQPQQPMMPPPQYGQIPPTMTVQPKQRMNGLLIPLIISLVLLVGALAFGGWAFMSRQDYKANVDQKIAAAVSVAQAQTSSAKDKEFIEREKNPLKEYKGPASYGTIDIQYPKTWSAFIAETSNSTLPIDGYLHPNFVPGLQSGTAYALHIEVTNTKYPDELKQFESKVKGGKVTVQPYQAPKVADQSAVGARITGEIEQGKQGVMVLLPLRDKTIKISTQANQFIGDFDKIIMANLTFVP